MGLFDAVRQALGLSAEADATRDADPEDLFGMSTAYVTMEADLDFVPTGDAALCFANVDSTAFRAARREVEAVLELGEEETGTTASFIEDSHGYNWVVLRDSDFENLVTSIHFAADTLIEEGFGSRLLAALFSFARDEKTAYWIYSFRRGSYYPFVPTGGRERDGTLEFKLESNLDGELDVEDDTSYWYPMWPEGDNHPWG
ncbi:MAG: PspA-associated protein PspAB [Halobacteriota archaeon]|uniref:PspA-associated protein PspAB n=1 Tax=Natronomonas sp. TaxID=2184060 RepID=UPI003976F025